MKGTRYSHIRINGAHHTACTKLTKDEKTRLHCIAVEQGISDYELTRRVLQAFIKKYPQPTQGIRVPEHCMHHQKETPA